MGAQDRAERATPRGPWPVLVYKTRTRARALQRKSSRLLKPVCVRVCERGLGSLCDDLFIGHTRSRGNRLIYIVSGDGGAMLSWGLISQLLAGAPLGSASQTGHCAFLLVENCPFCASYEPRWDWLVFGPKMASVLREFPPEPVSARAVRVFRQLWKKIICLAERSYTNWLDIFPEKII